MSAASFDQDCRRCPRLVAHLDQVRTAYPHYHARPVAPFGAESPRLLVVGLAPGMHGANATGRPFTGDHAGILLYQTLFDFGWSSAPGSRATDDRLRLRGCRITNAVKCLPPENKPQAEEIANCSGYLRAELSMLPAPAVILALGRIAHDAVLRAVPVQRKLYPFRHGAVFPLAGRRWLVDSFHCSRYNTQTRRLTPQMFADVFTVITGLLEAAE